ncbi:glycerol-3-phosphate dehydrogenase [Sphingomonas gilva]|uniref:Glycerol-3-phosphate dehydrogenase n=1 Tax=Sphingomonas gilva TaxID=2305907 RepID=A0A396RRE0_9SPHN|nr:glycerol-3-phosphate dehydrogenase [Sphingomonas gilva]RHW17872.1 glycerol-3-phosphate dehydrogenase [Sphingomonas gilva]
MTCDLLIIGGGINGCAIAREAALNHLSVLLVEKGDLASATSSKSTKLIHGGLRYLEYYEFGLVREALVERERLLTAAPHIVTPLTFVLPQENAVRPWWMVRAGLWLYDTLAGRSSLPRARGLRAGDTAYSEPLKGGASGFVYADAWVDDARLTVLNAMDAAAHGAEIAVGTELVSARREGDVWRAALSDGREVTARGIVNAAGPWVAETVGRLGVDAAAGVRLVKGSHIVVPRLYEGEHAYILQLADRRIVFAIPYHGDFTLIGTTDVPVETPGDARISDAEIAYLCDAVNGHFVRQIAPRDVVSSYSGVRPLYDDGEAEAKAVTRDYVLELDEAGPPLLSVFGGKITTARHLAQEAVEKIAAPLGAEFQPHTRARVLPGGMIPDLAHFIDQAREKWPFLGDRTDRMARAYGSLLVEMLEGVTDEAGMGKRFGGGLTALELSWMRDREWARCAEDALWRRSKLGLVLSEAEAAEIEAWWTKP